MRLLSKNNEDAGPQQNMDKKRKKRDAPPRNNSPGENAIVNGIISPEYGSTFDKDYVQHEGQQH
jgi:hypothetical protein